MANGKVSRNCNYKSKYLENYQKKKFWELFQILAWGLFSKIFHYVIASSSQKVSKEVQSTKINRGVSKSTAVCVSHVTKWNATVKIQPLYEFQSTRYVPDLHYHRNGKKVSTYYRCDIKRVFEWVRKCKMCEWNVM